MQIIKIVTFYATVKGRREQTNERVEPRSSAICSKARLGERVSLRARETERGRERETNINKQKYRTQNI